MFMPGIVARHGAAYVAPMARAPNLHSLYMCGMHPLGVECLGCKRRALVPAERFGGCQGDMTELRSLRLVCSSCGGRDVASEVFIRAGDAEAWVERLVVSKADGSRPSF